MPLEPTWHDLEGSLSWPHDHRRNREIRPIQTNRLKTMIPMSGQFGLGLFMTLAPGAPCL